MARGRKRSDASEIPVEKNRPGRCRNCGHGCFALALHKRVLYRKCKMCSEVFDVDNMLVVKKGVEVINESALEASV